MKVTGWTFCDNNSYSNINDMADDEFEQAKAAVIAELRKNKYKFSGSAHQYKDNCCPIIDNKYVFCVSMRSWGSIMQQAYDLPNNDGLGYVTWAWCTPDGETENTPKNGDEDNER